MFLFFGIVAFGAAAWLSYNMRREFAFHGTKQQVEISGKRFLVESKFEERKSRYLQTIGIAGSKGLELRVAREGALSRWLASIGIGRDIKTGHSFLDREFVFESDDPRAIRWLSDDKQIHATIVAILRLVPQQLIAHEGRIWLVFEGALADADQSKFFLARVADLLSQFAGSVPEQIVGKNTISLAKKAKAMTLLAVSTGLATAATLLGLHQYIGHFPALTDPWKFYWLAGAFGLFSGLVTLWCAARWIGDSARARVVLMELASVGLASWIVLSATLLAYGNRHWSRQPVVQEIVDVATYSKRGRSGSRFYLRLGNLADGRVDCTAIRIDQDTYQSLTRAQKAQVRWQKGFFISSLRSSQSVKRKSKSRTRQDRQRH